MSAFQQSMLSITSTFNSTFCQM